MRKGCRFNVTFCPIPDKIVAVAFAELRRPQCGAFDNNRDACSELIEKVGSTNLRVCLDIVKYNVLHRRYSRVGNITKEVSY